MRKVVWKELLLLYGALLLVNLIWSPATLGFTQASPHPYILVVLVIGARHGIAASLMATAVGVGLVALLSSVGSDPVGLESFLHKPWNLVIASWAVLGASVGSILEATKRQKDTFEQELGDLKIEYEEHKERLVNTERENAELREKVLGEGETLSTVYEMARRLTTLQGSDLFQASLELVERFVGCTQCSIYLLDPEKKQFQLKETRGSAKDIPPQSVARGDALFEKCLREDRVISIRDLFTAEMARQTVLGVLAAPLGVPSDEGPDHLGILLVQKLPLELLNTQSLSVFALLSDWVSRSLSLVQKFEEGHDTQAEVKIADLLEKRRLTTQAIQTLSRYAPTQVLALKVLGDPGSSELAMWNASRMLAVATHTNESYTKEPLEHAILNLLDNGTHLGGIFVTLPVQTESTGCTGLRLRIQERAELNSKAVLRLIKLYVTRFHGNLIMELFALESETSPSRRQYHLDNLLAGIEYLRSRKDAVSFSLGLNRPQALKTSTQDLLLGLTQAADSWTMRFAVLASIDLGYRLDPEVKEQLQRSVEPLGQEVCELLSG